MKISREHVQHVARLARLGLSEGEVAKFGEQLSSILENIEILNQVDTTGVPPTAQVTGLENVMRPDTTWQGLDLEQVLANAPRREGDYFRVQHVFEEGATEESP